MSETVSTQNVLLKIEEAVPDESQWIVFMANVESILSEGMFEGEKDLDFPIEKRLTGKELKERAKRFVAYLEDRRQKEGKEFSLYYEVDENEINLDCYCEQGSEEKLEYVSLLRE